MVIEFRLDPGRFDRPYECDVTVQAFGADKPVTATGSVRPTPGKGYKTINPGTYALRLGLHRRKTAEMMDPPTLTAAEHAGIVGSKRAFGATTKRYLKQYVRQGDGSYRLPDGAAAARGWMRKALTVADPLTDRLRIAAASGKPRLGLISEDDGEAPATTPGSDGRGATTATHVHIHSGPDDRRGARGCLTVPAKGRQAFLAPLVERDPRVEDWVSDGYQGERIGIVTVTAAIS